MNWDATLHVSAWIILTVGAIFIGIMVTLITIDRRK